MILWEQIYDKITKLTRTINGETELLPEGRTSSWEQEADSLQSIFEGNGTGFISFLER